MDEAIAGGNGGDGLLQWFQLLIYVASLGDWNPPDSWPDNEAREQVYEIFKRLDEMDVMALGAHTDGLTNSIPYLRFSPEAQQVADIWRDEWEQRLRGEHLKGMPVLASHLGKYRSLMPSLALLFHVLAFVSSVSLGHKVSGKIFSEVAREEVILACDWCDYLEQHIRCIYQAEVSPGLEGAKRLGEKILAGRVPNGETVRALYRHEWGGLTTNAQVMKALEILEEAGWVRVVTHQPPIGAPTQIVHLHPDLRGEANGGL